MASESPTPGEDRPPLTNLSVSPEGIKTEVSMPGEAPEPTTGSNPQTMSQGEQSHNVTDRDTHDRLKDIEHGLDKLDQKLDDQKELLLSEIRGVARDQGKEVSNLGTRINDVRDDQTKQTVILGIIIAVGTFIVALLNYLTP